MTNANLPVYDLRAGIDIENWPGYSWIRVISDGRRDTFELEFEKLCKGAISVPALLVRSAETANPGGRPTLLDYGAADQVVQMTAMTGNAGPGTIQSDNPPHIAVIRPLVPIRISMADSYVLHTRLCRQDIRQLEAEEFSIDGFAASILTPGNGQPRIRIPMDHSRVVPRSEESLQAWSTFQTMFMVPGFVLTFEVAPPDYLVLDNHRCLVSVTPVADSEMMTPCAQAHLFSAAKVTALQ